jgi:hypothetical protein
VSLHGVIDDAKQMHNPSTAFEDKSLIMFEEFRKVDKIL